MVYEGSFHLQHMGQHWIPKPIYRLNIAFPSLSTPFHRLQSSFSSIFNYLQPFFHYLQPFLAMGRCRRRGGRRSGRRGSCRGPRRAAAANARTALAPGPLPWSQVAACLGAHSVGGAWRQIGARSPVKETKAMGNPWNSCEWSTFMIHGRIFHV